MSDVSRPAAAAPSTSVQQAISDASRRTGVSFGFLLDQARRESGFAPGARAATSSASGLYQFIDQTWLRLVHEHGGRYGLAAEADAVAFDGRRFDVSNLDERQRILDLRLNARVNALMAGEYARENYDRLTPVLNRPVTETDLALAHFLGGDGAEKFLAALQRDPTANASRVFPDAANANKPVFFESDGSPRSLVDVYHFFAKQADETQLGTNRPWPGKGHFMSAVPAGSGGPMLSAPSTPTGSNLWQVLTYPPEE